MAYNPADFGEAKEQNARVKHHRLVEDSDNIYRVGPAFKSLAAAGKVFLYIKQHWGYKSAPDENGKTYPRLFLCPQEVDRNTEMVKVPCDECDNITNRQGIRDAKEQKYLEQKKNEGEIETLLAPLDDWLRSHNLDKKYICIAKNLQGEWGILWLPYRAKEAFDNMSKTLKAKKNINPLSIKNGCWVNFGRTGKGWKTSYTCTPYMEELEGGAERIKLDTLVEADFDAISESCPDLTTVGTKLTQEQIKELVECDGDPEEVDRIFKAGRKVRRLDEESSPAPERSPARFANDEGKVETKTMKREESVKKPEPITEEAEYAEHAADKGEEPSPAPVLPPEPEVDDEEAELLRKLAEKREAKAKAAAKQLVQDVGNKTPPVKPDTTPIEPMDVKKLSNEEFFKLFPRKKQA